jgi:hypothetical protein
VTSDAGLPDPTAPPLGTTYLNFTGVEDSAVDAVRRAYRPEDLARLQAVKAAYDPTTASGSTSTSHPGGTALSGCVIAGR